MRYSDLRLVEQKKKTKTVRQQILEKYDSESAKELFASYTVIEKVGINPRSGYNTPLGIYCYPLEYVIQQYKADTDVPYMGDTPYVNIFRATNPDRKFDIHNYQQNDFDRDVEKLRSYFVEQKNIADTNTFDDIVLDSDTWAMQKTSAGKLWYITKTLANKIGSGQLKESRQDQALDLLSEDLLTEWDDNDKGAARATVVWNGIFRNILGYDYAIDPNGSGTIHINERTQAVFFSKPALQVIDRIKNSNSVYYKLRMIYNMGQDNNDDRDRISPRQVYEYEKLIAQNLNNPSILNTQLKRYFEYVQSPKLKRSLIRKNPLNIVKFAEERDPATIKIAKNKFIKMINTTNEQGQKQSLEILSQEGSFRLERFLEIVTSGESWPALESGILNLLDKTPNSMANKLASTYVLQIKKEPWPEYEKYINNGIELSTYINITGANFDQINPGDTVKILAPGADNGKQAKVAAGGYINSYDLKDPETDEFLGSYTVAQLEKIKGAEPSKSSNKNSQSDKSAQNNDLKIGDEVEIIQGQWRGLISKIKNIDWITNAVKLDNGPIVAPDILKKLNDAETIKKVAALKAAVKKLVNKGKKTGYVTYAELNTIKGSDEQIEDIISMLSEMDIEIVENEPEPSEPVSMQDILAKALEQTPKPEAKKTKGPTGKKIMQFVAQAKDKGSNITQNELDKFLPPGTIKDENLNHILELLKDQGITVDGKPITIPSDEPAEIPAKKGFEYDGTQKLTTKEKNAWEQIMIKSLDNSVVKPLLNRAFKNYALSSEEFYTLAKHINFPFWVAGKYLGNAGVKVDTSAAAKEYLKNNKNNSGS